MQQQARVIIDQDEEVGALAGVGARVRHERTDQHIADPDLIRSVSFVAPVGAWLAGECGPLETTPLEVLADGAFSDAEVMAGVAEWRRSGRPNVWATQHAGRTLRRATPDDGGPRPGQHAGRV